MSLKRQFSVLFMILALAGTACSDTPPEGAGDQEKSTFTPDENTPKKLNASHILIQHVDSQRATGVERTKEEALKLAKEVAAKAQAKDADFAALAKEYSDGPSAGDGGSLGNFAPGQMVPAFSAATLKLKVGEVSGPVESDFGYHVIQRNKILEDLCAAHILIQYKGSERAGAAITRDKEAAFALATELSKKAKAKDADFAALAKENSDGPSGPRGGDLGQFAPGNMIPEFSAATVKLKMNEVSGPVETAFGYHVILRKPLPPPPAPAKKVGARHILLQYKGSMRAAESVTRTKEEAKTEIDEVMAKLKKGSDFEALAKEHSDCPSAPKGGDLGVFPEGVMHPKFNDTAFGLEVKGTSDIIETPFGYHVIYRYK